MDKKDHNSRSDNHLKESSSKKTTLLEKIQRNSTKKQEFLKKLEKDER